MRAADMRACGATPSTVEALAYQLRDGFSALRNPSAQRRLLELSDHQVKEMAHRLTKERWNLAGIGRVPPWTESEIEALVELWMRYGDA